MDLSIICHVSPKGGVDDRIARILNEGSQNISYTKEHIGALRGIFDNENTAPLIDLGNKKETEISDDVIAEAAVKMADYIKSKEKRHKSQLKNSIYHMAKTFAKLYKVDGWNYETRRNRINAVVAEFTNEVSLRLAKAREEGRTHVTREQIVNGYEYNGVRYDGQFSIFEAVFDKIFARYKNELTYLAKFDNDNVSLEKQSDKVKAKYSKAAHLSEEHRKMLANWAALCAFARMSLRDTEGLKLGNTIEYAAPTTPDNFIMESPMEDEIDLEQSIKEAWQEVVSHLSSFGSLGTEVRRFIATVPSLIWAGRNLTTESSDAKLTINENGDIVDGMIQDGSVATAKDDLGYTINLDPMSTHQYLADILRGSTSESSMLKKLRKLKGEDLVVRAIYNALANEVGNTLEEELTDVNRPKNPILLTQLFLDMHKNMVKYSALLRSVKNFSKNIYAAILNRTENPLREQYLLNLERAENSSGESLYYTKKGADVSNGKFAGELNWDNLASWYIISESMFPQKQENKKENNEGDEEKDIFNENSSKPYAVGFYRKGFGKGQRINYLMSASSALGVPMTRETAARIVQDKEKLRRYTKALEKFRQQTFGEFGLFKESTKRDAFMKLVDIIKRGAAGNRLNADAIDSFDARNTLNKWAEQRRNEGNPVTFKSFIEATSGKNGEDSPGYGVERINEMLDIVASVSIDLNFERSVPWFDRHGHVNSRFSDRTPMYMGDMVDRIRDYISEGDYAGLEDYIMDKWGHNSFFYNEKTGKFRNMWLEDFMQTVRRKSVNTYDLARIFEFVEFLGSNIDKQVSIFENFTQKQHAQAMLKQFLVDRFGNKKKPIVRYPSFILGDSGVQMFFTAKRYDKAPLLKNFEAILEQERERIKYVNATNSAIKIDFAKKMGLSYDNDVITGNVTVYNSDGKALSNKELKELGYRPIENYSDTAEEFTQLKFLNPDYQNGDYWKMITGKEKIPENRAEAIQDVLDAIGTDAVSKTIEAFMNNAVEEFKKKLVSVDILKYDENTKQYVLSDRNYFREDAGKLYDSVDEFIEDFYWNTKYATIQQIQMFTIDPSFYDHRYPVKDLQKRYKEIYAPGRGLSIEARDYNGNLYTKNKNERVAYFDDIEVNSKDVNPYFFKVLQKEFGENHPFVSPEGKTTYQKNTLTDGQGYRTLESYRKVMGMAGQWTPVMEAAYNEIKKIRDDININNPGGMPTESQLRKLSELAAIFQPIKPYMFTLEKILLKEDEKNPDNNDYALVPVQHKYAEIILIPELMADGKLKEIAKWMESNDIDMVCSTKCVKVGAFGSVNLTGVNTQEGIANALNTAWIHNLAWEDYKIQSGVPEHLNHAQLFGTQPRKLIFDSINKRASYERYLKNIFKDFAFENGKMEIALPTKNGVQKVRLNGSTLIALYNNLIMGNLFDDYADFEEQTSTNKALSDKALQKIIANANQSEDNAFGLSLIEEGMTDAGEFVIPLGEPCIEHDSFALLSSLFKMMVNKQKIKGGSAVQASAMGLKGMSDSGDLFEVVSPEGDNVLYDEIELAFNVSYTTASGKKINLKYEDWVNPDGTLKMSNKIVYGEDAREYLSWPVSGRNEYGRPNEVDENGYDPNGYYVPLIERAYPGCLDIISYRIPTEKEYSMINCKVFRFSRPELGGILKVPSSRTTTAGFDFDIDKLYFFMREYVQKELDKDVVKNVWDKIYKTHRHWQKALELERQKDILGKEAISQIDDIFYHKNSAKSIDSINDDAEITKLFKYWKAAGLEGTAEEAFTRYLELHRDEFPDLFDTYNPEVSPFNPIMDSEGNMIKEGNTRAARNNLLIDLFRQRLMDKETLKARYTPGGFANNTDAALEMRVLQYADETAIMSNGKVDFNKVRRYMDRVLDRKDTLKDPEPEYDFSDPTAILVYNQQNQIAAKLIGIFANQNTNHVYASILHKMRLKTPISFGNHVSTLEGKIGEDISISGLQDFLNPPKGIDVDTNVAEYLAASVDAVKDPVLNFLNLNVITADAGAMLARLGYTPAEIGLLFNQPIIRELCDYIANENLTSDVAISNMLKKYGGDIKLVDIEYNPMYASTQALADNIVKYRNVDANTLKNNAYRTSQLHILKLFNEILAAADELNAFVQCTRFTAANSIGSTWGDYYAQEMKVINFLNNYGEKNKESRIEYELFDESSARFFGNVGLDKANLLKSNKSIIQNNSELLDLSPEEYAQQMMFNPLAFEQCMWDLYRKAVKKIFSKYFPFDINLYSNMRDFMSGLSKKGNLDADTINSLHRDFMQFLLSRQEGSAFDGDAMNDTFPGAPVPNRYYYTEIFPMIMQLVKANSKNSHSFLDMLKVKGNTEKGKGLKVILPGIGSMQRIASNRATEIWADAANSDIPISVTSNFTLPLSKIAMDYYFYNFYNLGFNFHPTSGMSNTPTLLKTMLRIDNGSEETMGYIDYIRNLINNDRLDPSRGNRINLSAQTIASFAKQYILNHLDNRAFTFEAKSTAKDALEKKVQIRNDKVWKSTITLDENTLGNDLNLFVLKRTDKNVFFKPVIAIESNGTKHYYIANNSSADFNVSSIDNPSMTYTKVVPLGNRGDKVQYFRDHSYREYQKNNGRLGNFRIPFNITEESQSGEVNDARMLTPAESMDALIDHTWSDWINNITDEEWQQLTDAFNRTKSPWTRDINIKGLKFRLGEKATVNSVKLLNRLYTQIKNGDTENLKTPMKVVKTNGREEIVLERVCGI